ncbi:Uroporphyrinogen-III synthase [hydrothermal vent metagenome]|uniref:uroporphyrinogen-III synthase n=1 Tax=hydrothermal vent metagenome TaxID=652676 RepID=A0A3B0TNW7_9ZZZZ
MKTAQKTLLVTRPSPDNKATARLLQKAGFEVELLPVLSFQVLDFDPPGKNISAIAVTSANALNALEQKGILDELRQIPLFAVGRKTAQKAKSLGFENVEAAGGNLVSLADLIMSRNITGGEIFYPAARHLSGDLAAMLGEHDIAVKTITAYQMEPLDKLNDHQRTMLGGDSIGAGLFYSRRSAEIFIELCAFGGVNAHNLPVLCLSQNVAEAFRGAGFKQIHISSAPNQQAMVALALSFAAINSK